MSMRRRRHRWIRRLRRLTSVELWFAVTLLLIALFGLVAVFDMLIRNLGTCVPGADC